MTYDEAIKVLRTSRRKDWICADETNSYTYKKELGLRIVVEPTIERLTADWIENIATVPAYKVKCNVFYNSSYVTTILLVKVEGGKARIPVPGADGRSVNKLDCNVALICDDTGLCVEYMKKFFPAA